MKKLLLGFILCAGLTSCSCSKIKEDVKESTTTENINRYTEIVKIEGHKYIICRSRGISGDGICIIHAESCECKNKNKED